jgi:pilus assembly protein CpaD
MTRNPLVITARRVIALALRGAVIAGLAATLVGCYTEQESTGSVPFDYRQRHPIAIKEGYRTLEVFVGAGRGGLTPAQRADVLAFAQNWRQEGTGGFLIDSPARTANQRAAASALREIRSILAAVGVPPRAIIARSYQPADRDRLAALRINYLHIVAEAGPCGLWPDNLGPGNTLEHSENRPYWNFGCATQRNLAAMVDNPADLVQPRGETAVYRARRTIMLDKYRKGEDTAAAASSANKGAISDIGK